MRIIALFGGGTANKSYVVTRQRRVNCYYENRKDQDKTKVAIYGTPGLQAKYTIGTSGPLRAFVGTQSILYAVANTQFMVANGFNGAVSFSASIGSSSGNATIAYSPSQVMLVDGNSGWIYTPSSNTFVMISAFPAIAAQTCTFISSFFVAEQPGTNVFWVSNANDGTMWNALAFSASSSDAGNIVAVDNLNGNLLLFLQQGSEFWQDVGAFPEPFAPILSAANQFGLAAIFSRGHVDNSLIFLAQTPEGAVQFVQIYNGYATRVISDPDIDSIINGFTVVSDATCLVYQIDAHKFYQCSFPTANRSFLYDCSTGQWSHVQTGVPEARHTGNFAAYFAGGTLISDYATNQIYAMNPDQYTDNGVTIVREIITRHILSNFNRIRPSLLYLDMETGVGLQTGQGSNPQVMLQYSKDNGRTWSGERWASLGLVGQYMARVIWRRFGSTRDATWRIRMTDPVKFVITEGAVKVAERQPAEKLG